MVVGSPTQWALLALLAARRSTVVGRGQIVDAFWGGGPHTVLNDVRIYVAGLRGACISRTVGDSWGTSCSPRRAGNSSVCRCSILSY
ncbi:winged helix-turn-helix domain-containing protein [Streptomyces demainii]|uniref:winged helix-turn-helix domain-containing protein n=1 Tax=Streptomyces demainii TaxID=588122 RepID=UPI0027D78A01|nr:winged helix-turn-helix domain-containing protein [Streptomyces demainii]